MNMKIEKLRTSFPQDVVFVVSNWAIKTPKSFLVPSVIKPLGKNTEVVKFVNKHGHDMSCHLIEEIEMYVPNWNR